jgi:hypothetical protein
MLHINRTISKHMNMQNAHHDDYCTNRALSITKPLEVLMVIHDKLDHAKIMAALHLETGPIPLEAKCIKFQPLLGRRPALTTHYNKIITRANFPICKGLRDKKPRQFKKSSIF